MSDPRLSPEHLAIRDQVLAECREQVEVLMSFVEHQHCVHGGQGDDDAVSNLAQRIFVWICEHDILPNNVAGVLAVLAWRLHEAEQR